MNNLQETIRRLQMNNKLIVLRCCGGSGESQLLSGLMQGYTTVDLSLPDLHMQARQNPAFFLRSLSLPAHLANLQYAPFLLAHIIESGLPLERLLGSCTQSYYLEEAGLQRVAFLELPLAGASDEGRVFVPDAARLRALAERETDIFTAVLQSRVDGGAAAYVRRFLQRDIMERTTVSDEVKFYRFLCVAASMCGGVVNYSGLAANVGVTAPTVKQWLRFLAGAGVVYLLQPIADIAGKRLVKAPKLFFTDTGAAAHLLQLREGAALAQSVYFKNLLENYVTNVIRESYLRQGAFPDLRFYKDSNNQEINLLLGCGQGLYPIYIRLDKFYAHKLAKTSEIVRPYAVREGLELRPGCVFTLGGGCAPVNGALWQVGISCLQYD